MRQTATENPGLPHVSLPALPRGFMRASPDARRPSPTKWRGRVAAVALAFCAALAAFPVAARGAAQAPPVPLLWKVSDADNAVYLLGSFHLLKPGDYPLAAEVDAAFEDAEALLFELSPQEMDAPELQAGMLQKALRPGGTLADDLDPDTWRRLQEYAQRRGLPLAALSPYKAWFVALQISVAEMTGQGLDPRLGLDRHFMDAAAAAGKPAAGLERASEQIAMLDGMDAAEQLQLLKESLDQAEGGADQTARLHAAWRAGRADELWNEMALEMRRNYPRLYRRINVERNDAWLPRIESRLRQPGTDDTLVVVGALHLLGSDGVVEKLRAKGYRVERLCAACKAATAQP